MKPTRRQLLRLANGTQLIGVIAVTIVAGNLPAEAATVEAMTLQQMAQRADFIFVGRAVSSHADWNVRRTQIYTYTTFEVDRFLKGGTGERQVTLRLWGGQLGPMRAIVPGTPSFAPGEEVLLFCVGSGARIPTLLGLASGKFTLTRDQDGEAILKRDISGLILTNYRTGSQPASTPPTRYRLAEVEARIDQALGRSGARREQ
jgi:hypothetical protein